MAHPWLVSQVHSPQERTHEACGKTRPGILPWAVMLASTYCVVVWILIHLGVGSPALRLEALGWLFRWMLHVPILAGAARPFFDFHGPADFWLLLFGASAYHVFFWGWLWHKSRYGLAIGVSHLVSLARLQFLAWFVIGFATSLTAAVYDLTARRPEVDWFADPALVGSLGISMAGLIGSTTILAAKRNTDPNPKKLRPTAQKLAETYSQEYARDLLVAARSKETIPALTHARVRTQAESHPDLKKQIQHLNALSNQATPKTAGFLLAQLQHGASAQEAMQLAEKHKWTLPEDSPLLEKTLKGLQGGAAGLLTDWVAYDLLHNTRGVAYANRCDCEARLSDIFHGDEMATTHHFDLGKLQFVAATCIALGVVVYNLLAILHAPMPEAAAGPFSPRGLLPEGLLTLTGLSTVGYLGNKLPSATPKL